jgi:hypothetical protein
MKRKWKVEAQQQASAHHGNAHLTPHIVQPSNPTPRRPSGNLSQSQVPVQTDTDTVPVEHPQHSPSPKQLGARVRSSSPAENHPYIAPPPPPKSMRLRTSPPEAEVVALKDEDVGGGFNS